MGKFQDFRRVVETANNIQPMVRGQKNKLVTFKANASNTGIIYITVDQDETRGYPLNAGEGLSDVIFEDGQTVFMWGDTSEDRLEGIIYDNPFLKVNEIRSDITTALLKEKC